MSTERKQIRSVLPRSVVNNMNARHGYTEEDCARQCVAMVKKDYPDAEVLVEIDEEH